MTEPVAAIDAATPKASAAPIAVHRGRRRWLAWGLVVVLGVGAAAPVGWNFWSRHRREDFRSQCKQAEASKEWPKLLELSRAWRNWDSRDDDALMFIAQAAVELEQLDVAVDALGGVNDAYRGALQALAYRGEILQSGLNRPFDAEATWLRMLQIHPRADMPRQRLIYFYAMTLQRRKMAAQIEEAIRLSSEPPEAYTYLIMKDALNFSDGLAQTTKWRTAYPDDETLQAAQAVYAAKKTADRQMATFGSQTVAPGDQSLVDKCLASHPGNIEALMVKLDRAIFEGQTGRVRELLQQAPGEAETDNRFWRTRGWLLMMSGRYDAAADSLHKALELHAFDWQARWLLADVFRKLGRTEEADKLSDLALKGKELQQAIFERPNARHLDDQLVRKIHAYLQQAAPTAVLAAWERRM